MQDGGSNCNLAGYQKGLTSGRLNALEAEVETLRASILNSVSKFSDIHQQNETDRTCADGEKNVESSVCMNKDPGNRKQEVKDLKAIYSKNAPEYIELMGMRETCELVEMDHVGYSVSKQPNEVCFDPEYPWIGSEKSKPWWHTSDRDELASLVAEKSLNHIENCDLPPPKKMCVGRDPCSHLRHFDGENFAILFESERPKCWSLQPNCSCTWLSRLWRNTWRTVELVKEIVLQYGSDKTCSTSTTQNDISELRQGSESDSSKVQLLEALCPSQTCAREAEKAAKQAFAEKEHIIKLFIRQASQLFAYKQWFQLQQLEILYHQIKNNHLPITTLFPVLFPWMHCKGKKLQNSRKATAKGKRGKRSQSRQDLDIAKYAVAFALGMSLVGAG